MAIRWLEGFDANTSADGGGYDIRYPVTTLPATIDFAAGRFFGRAMQAGTDPIKLQTPAFADHATWVVGMSLLWDATESVDLLTFYRGGSIQLKVQVSEGTDGDLVVAIVRGATTLGSYTIPRPDDWIHFELKVTFHTTTGTYELRVNETTVLSGSGANTANTGSNDADQVQLWIEIPSIADFFTVDHLYILDGSGDNATFLGDRVVEEKTVLSDGTYLEWDTKDPGDLTHAENLDEDGEPDGNTTYNAAATIDLTDTFVMAPLVALITVDGVQVEVVVGQEEAPIDDDHVKIVSFIDTNEHVSSDLLLTAVQPEYESLHWAWDVNPETTTDWTPEDLAAAEFGIRSLA